MKTFACLQFLLIGLLIQTQTAGASVVEYPYDDSTAAFLDIGRTSEKVSNFYSAIVFGAPEKPRGGSFIAAIRDMGGDRVESAVRYGGPINDRTPANTVRASINEESGTRWWAILLTAIGLVFYQIRRPVRPRIGIR